MSLHGSFYYHKAVRLNIPGHLHFYTFSCYRRLPLLTNELWRSWLADSIAYARQKLDIDLWAYVFMPEHVHLLLKPRWETYRISEFMQLAKNPMARRVVNSLKKNNSPLLNQLRVPQCDGSIQYCYWQPGGGYDLNIWDMEMAIEKAEYCHHNPVKRNLVQSPEQWKWSSFRWIERGERDLEPVCVDDWIDE
jgi:putative transposase